MIRRICLVGFFRNPINESEFIFSIQGGDHKTVQRIIICGVKHDGKNACGNNTHNHESTALQKINNTDLTWFDRQSATYVHGQLIRL